MRLTELVDQLGGSLSPAWGDGPKITGVHLDSRRVGVGDLFAALPGTKHDGARFAREAISRGAAAILTPALLDHESLGAPASAASRAPVQWVHEHARRVAGEAAAHVYGDPTRDLFVIGVTGTNGKTTTAHIAGQLLAAAGRRPAVLGTTGNRLADGCMLAATHTTADAPELQRMMVRHRELGGDSLCMEVSSHALDQERVAGLHFDVAVFTNLTRDHLDYHGDLERYAQAKERLFLALAPGESAVINADDPLADRMASAARSKGARVVTYSARLRGDLCASRLRTDLTGTHLTLSGMGISECGVRLRLAGRYNVENALGAAAAALLSGASPSIVLEGLATATGAPGRLEPVDTHGRGFSVLIDYAHTEAALENVCRVVKGALERGAEQRLIVVFGCGGDRDAGKRGPMGRVVNEWADVAVVTSDNPRSEDPERIIAEVLAGMEPPRAERLVEPDRRTAIERAVARARRGDVVLIAGKGHETTQTVGARVLEFDDRKAVSEALA